MAAKKNQHWVPKFYLNAFAIPETRNQREPQIYALSKWERDDVELKRVGTRNVAASAYLYSPVDDTGVRDDSFEDKQAGLESTLAHLWRMLAEGNVPLVDGYRKGLALFVANVYLRHPRQRLLSRHHLEQLQIAFDSHLQQCDEVEMEMLVDGKVTQEIMTREEYERDRAQTENDFHRHFVDLVDDTTVEIAKILLDKRWNVIVSPTADFITSDNPICLTGPKDKPFGFRTSGVSVTVPLTPEKMLFINDTPGRENCYVLNQTMKGDVTPPDAPLNWQTFGNSYRFIFGPKPLWYVLEQGLQFCDNLKSSDPNSPYYALLSQDGRNMRLSRNAPCWCGSGAKYKHCHLALTRELGANADSLRNVTHERRDLAIEDNEVGH